MHLLDVLVTQHAKWTAKRIRRGLFGQSIVDFSTASWSSIQLKNSAFCPASQQKREQPKKTPRLLRSFAQSRVVTEKVRGDQPLIPGMSPYSDDVDMDAGTAEHSGGLSVSTGAAGRKKFSHEPKTGSLSLSTGATNSKEVSLSFSTGAATSEKLSQESDAESVASGSEESDHLR